ncbi:MAG: PRC-barrel domain-containing protein [Desulfobulbus sp.]|nr:PRC-barrel domain-containing protein [Desulfobulbus sp.]
MNKEEDVPGGSPGPVLMGAKALIGYDVRTHKGEDIGDIKDIMLDVRSGMVRYAVLAFGGFIGMGEKFFAVPWIALTLDTTNKRFILNVEKEHLAKVPGFDKDRWPDGADPRWAKEIHAYFGVEPAPEDAQV